MSKIVPNTFQTPNFLVDDFMQYLDGDEVKCYLVIIRKTLGWLKRSDRISKSQLETLTGLSAGRVDACMKNLCAFGLVVRQSENDPFKNYGIEWSLEMDDAKINIYAMQSRAEEHKLKNSERIWKMNQHRGGGSVAQTDGVVTQDGGGSVAQTPQKPLSKATKEQAHAKIIEQANKQVDAMIDLERKASASWPGREKLPPAICDLADEFVNLTGIKPNKKELMWWMGCFSDWLSFGVLRQDIKTGIDYAKAHDFAVMTPGSLTKTVRMLAAKRTQPSQEPAYVY